MYDLSFEAKIIDTPGIKGFGLVDMDKDEVGDYFPEFFALKQECKFNNCLHVQEPGCAVKKALEEDKIAYSRYKSYLQILEGEDENYRTDNWEKNMRAVIQRVSEACVTINKEKIAKISEGLLILLGIVNEDDQEDINWLSNKIANLRIFSDEDGVMNKSLIEINGEAIVVSQFTLHANTRKGNRPSYIKAAKPDIAVPLYEEFIKRLELDLGKKVQTGQFGADMKIDLINNGPVTIIIDTKDKNI